MAKYPKIIIDLAGVVWHNGYNGSPTVESALRMARRTRLPPPILKVETLSDGKAKYIGQPMVDDFTGQPIEPKLAQGPNKPLLSGPELAQQGQRRRLETNRLLLEAVLPRVRNWEPLLPKARAKAMADSALPRPKAKADEAIIHVDGKPLRMVFPRVDKPWRRV